MKFEQWVERIYEESDVGRGIATTVAGGIGLTVYLFSNDWVLAAFVSIIVFPIVRILASTIESYCIKLREQKNNQEQIKKLYDNLGMEERAVVEEFVLLGGNVLTWEQCNESRKISITGVESLINRGMLHRTVTADGMTEAFALDTELFDYAQTVFSNELNALIGD